MNRHEISVSFKATAATALLACASCLALTSNRAAAQDSPRVRPNILLLLSDDQRHDTIHALGNAVIRTPSLDRLVTEGFAFTHVFATVPVCTPARAEILTGRSPFRNGVRYFGHRMHPGLMNLARTFAGAGYLTAYAGKWHNDGSPADHGFEVMRRVFQGGMRPHEMAFEEDGKKVSGFSSEVFAGAAIELIERSPRRPWLLQVSFTAPHDPRTPPGRFKGMYPPEAMPLPANFMPEHPFDNGEMTIRDELLEKWPRTPEAIRRHLADYYGMISHLDEQVGRILDALERSGQAENTIVVFAGDNGLAIGSHGLLGKMSLYDHSVRVPLVMRGPGIPRSVRSAALCSLEDIFPTLCDLAGAAAPPDLDGLSLAPILRGARTAVRDHIFGAYQDVQRMVRSERWKLIQYPRIGKTQLFDLANDPHELRDLLAPRRARKTEWYTPEVDAAETQRVARDLERKLDGWRKAVGDSG